MIPDNKAIYDANWDQWSDQKIYGPASRWLRWLIQQNLGRVDIAAVKQVLDVGCGQGETTAMLARLLPAAQTLGIDFSEGGIATANRLYGLPNLAFRLDPGSAQLHPGSADLVMCLEVLEHVVDWRPLLQRICTASRRYVMLSCPTGRMRRFEAAVGHVRNFRKGEVEAFMHGEGFATLNVFYAGFPFFSPLYRDLCEVTDAGTSRFATGPFGLRQKVVSNLLFVLFRYLSMTRVGDQFCGVFERR